MRAPTGKLPFRFLPLLLLAAFALPVEPAVSHGSGAPHEGANVDLVLRKVTVTPVRAHVGDLIRIEMEWEYWGGMSNDYYDTTVAEVSANGRVAASKPFVLAYGVQMGDGFRDTLLWDTKGMAPGKYRIRGEGPLRLDATPYNNFLVVKETVVLLPAGAPFPSGEGGGGTVVANNPFRFER